MAISKVDAGREVSALSRAGVGFSDNPSSRQAGIDAAQQALDSAALTDCDVVLMFATSKHDPVALRDAVRSVVGPRPRLTGGSAIGALTNDQLGYEGHQVGVAAIASKQMQIDMFVEHGLPDNETEVGRRLGNQIRNSTFDGTPNLLMLYDIVKRRTDQGISLNMATRLLAGLDDALGKNWPPAAGCGLTGDMQWNPTFQIFDDKILQHSALALALHGGVRMDTITMHGCRPSTGYHRITRADGNTVLEINGRPTLDLIAEFMGQTAETADFSEYPLFITLGINQGEKFGKFREEDYLVRLCMDVDRERRGLTFFGDDLTEGTEVQLMRRNINFDYIAERSHQLLEQSKPRRPFLALYIDCGGRAATYAGTELEEAAEVQRVIGSDIPLLGWYVGCEIAKTRDRMQSHNWSGVLCLLSE